MIRDSKWKVQSIIYKVQRARCSSVGCLDQRDSGCMTNSQYMTLSKFNFINPDTEGSHVTLWLLRNAYLHVDLPAAQTQSPEPIGNQAMQSVLMCPTEGFSLLCVLAQLEKNTSRVHQSVRGESRGRVSWCNVLRSDFSLITSQPPCLTSVLQPVPLQLRAVQLHAGSCGQ